MGEEVQWTGMIKGLDAELGVWGNAQIQTDLQASSFEFHVSMPPVSPLPTGSTFQASNKGELDMPWPPCLS